MGLSCRQKLPESPLLSYILWFGLLPHRMLAFWPTLSKLAPKSRLFNYTALACSSLCLVWIPAGVNHALDAEPGDGRVHTIVIPAKAGIQGIGRHLFEIIGIIIHQLGTEVLDISD